LQKTEPLVPQQKISKFFNTNQLCSNFFPEALAPKYHVVEEPIELSDEMIHKIKKADKEDRINEQNVIRESEEALNRVKKNYAYWYYPKATVKFVVSSATVASFGYSLKLLLDYILN
jgi:hypothetical protein